MVCTKIFSYIRYVVFKRVPKDFSYVDLNNYCQDLFSSLNLDHQKTVIFLTAVDISTYSHAEAVYRGIKAKSLYNARHRQSTMYKPGN
uniref:Uncharacterized protein n=1 Tax=Ignisphaera aggregans TaxID=334771 RepID=A0A7C5UY70_9CREN